MLSLKTAGRELFNEETGEFIYEDSVELHLEHSLVSLAAWEARWHKPFLEMKNLQKRGEVTEVMALDYINCMSLDGPIKPSVLENLTVDEVHKIFKYTEEPMTATWFTKEENRPNREIVTAEIIYYAMFSYGIPIECENWNLNRLMTLIKVFGEKNKPAKKMTPGEIAKRNSELNRARRQKLKSKG